VALQTTTTVPSGDQFVYTKTEDGDGKIGQSWLSVNGTRDSLIYGPGSTVPLKLPGCVSGHSSQRTLGEDGKPLDDFIPKQLLDEHRPLSMTMIANRFFGGKIPMDGPIVTIRCTPQPAFFPDMPATASAMLSYLTKTHVVYPAGLVPAANDLNDVAKNVGDMLDSDYLLPAQQAALYQFLATTPGITLQQSVKDVAGRPGIGVGWSFEGSSAMLIFDPTTYQYLGESTTGTNGEAGGDALLQTAIVDSVNDVPGQGATPAPTNGA
jgi:hypothetical protein